MLLTKAIVGTSNYMFSVILLNEAIAYRLSLQLCFWIKLFVGTMFSVVLLNKAIVGTMFSVMLLNKAIVGTMFKLCFWKKPL